MTETLIPTCSFRWFIDYDGERILQQRFHKPSGGDLWRRIPEVEHDDDPQAPAPQPNTPAPDTATVAQHMKDFEAFVAQIAPKLHWKVWQDLGSDRSLYCGGFDGWQHGFGMTSFEPRLLAELIPDMKAALALAATPPEGSADA